MKNKLTEDDNEGSEKRFKTINLELRNQTEIPNVKWHKDELDMEVNICTQAISLD